MTEPGLAERNGGGERKSTNPNGKKYGNVQGLPSFSLDMMSQALDDGSS